MYRVMQGQPWALLDRRALLSLRRKTLQPRASKPSRHPENNWFDLSAQFCAIVYARILKTEVS